MVTKAAKESMPKKKANSYNRPYWSEDLTMLAKKRNELKGKDMKKWSEVNKEMDDKIRVAKTRFWKEYMEEINREDSTKMWKTIKMLNEGKNNDRKKADRQVKVNASSELGAYENEGEYDRDFTMEELEVALNQTGEKKRWF